MTRSALILSLGLLLPQSAVAQFEFAGHAGVHIDRAPEHDRLVTTGGAAMLAEAGEASAFGGRLGYWHRPNWGFQFDLSRSSNSSWSGSTPLPPPAFANRTTYLSARGVARTAPANSLQLAIAAGPALMVYSGPGENLRTRDVDVGGVLELSARWRVVHNLSLELAISNYLYPSTYQGAESSPPNANTAPSVSVVRYDMLLLPGLVYSWR